MQNMQKINSFASTGIQSSVPWRCFCEVTLQEHSAPTKNTISVHNSDPHSIQSITGLSDSTYIQFFLNFLKRQISDSEEEKIMRDKEMEN